MRILADVDTGIDDACALLYLCGRPEVELVGVTTSAGNTSARQAALNTLAVLEVAERGEVEVAVGEAVPLVRPLVTTPETHGPDGLGYTELPDLTARLSERPWLELWRKALSRHPGEVTLLVTGPLTNLAVALREIPELPQLVNRIVVMGGCFWHLGNTTPTAEWNTWVDPDAAREVYAAFEGLPTDRLPIVCATQVTETIEYTPPALDALLQRAGLPPVGLSADLPRSAGPRASTGSAVHDLLVDALRFYFEFHQDHDQGYVAHLHDLFAAQVAAGRALSPTRATVVDVEAASDLLRGTTVCDDRGIWGRQPNARLVVDSRPEEVFADFADSLARLAGRGTLEQDGPAEDVGSVTVRRAGLADIPQIRTVLAHGLAEDPMMLWLFGEEEDPRRRLSRIAAYFSVQVERRVTAGLVDVATVDDEVVGAALWGERRLEPSDLLPRPGSLALMLLGEDWGAATSEAMTAARDAAPAPSGPYLAVLAVLPQLQGHRIGQRLVEASHRRFGESTWLESTNPRNHGFYQRLGYRRVHQVQVALDGPLLTCFVRSGQAGSPAPHA
ncbi:GNAT family N-acetyltransferase [Luteococcus peritonei]|uniref:GNAT family N-acetyltransferase n=1 Tax=Luteococcus peritonei TaxID=88874 RepID=A0ABW4RXR2_9ACTN